MPITLDKNIGTLIVALSVADLFEILSRKEDVTIDNETTILAPDQNVKELIIYQLGRNGIKRKEINERLDKIKE